jgi:hypothetical protein
MSSVSAVGRTDNLNITEDLNLGEVRKFLDLTLFVR